MRAPREFDYLVKCFHPESMEDIDKDEWVASVVRGFLRPEKREVVRAFLDEVLDGTCSDDELEEFWRRPSPTINFSTGGHRWFLGRVRDVLNREWPKSGRQP
jgi:hypothetical protein